VITTHRAMAARTLCASIALVAIVVAATTVAVAQTRSRSPHPSAKPKPTSSAPAEPPADDKSTAAASPIPQNASPDAGALPPPDDLGAGGSRLSPLNPTASEFSDAGPPASSVDYDRLLAEISSLRARVAAVSDTLFHSRISITLETSGDHGRIAAVSVSVDDGVVWTGRDGFRAEDAATVYEHAVAPGHHAVTVDVERRDDRESTFRTTQRSRFIVDVPADQKLSVRLKVADDSNMGGDFPSDKRGQYDLRVQARAQAQAIGR
jgi:hypothetical protein